MKEGEKMEISLKVIFPKGLISNEDAMAIHTAARKAVSPGTTQTVGIEPDCSALNIDCSKLSGENIGKMVDKIRSLTTLKIAKYLNLTTE